MRANEYLKIDSNGKSYCINKVQLGRAWSFSEKIGIAIINPRGIDKLVES